MKSFPAAARKAEILIYLIIVLVGAAAGASFGYVYRKLPAMQLRYQASQKETGEFQDESGEQAQAAKHRQSSFDDFVYEKFYRTVRGITDSWGSHVKDSLKAERNRVLEEKINK